MSVVLSAFFVNLCLLVCFTFIGGLTYTGRETGHLQRRVVRYLITVAAGAALIYYGVTVGPGVRIDYRTVPVALAGLFGGAVPAFGVALPIALYRAYVGGAGALAGVVGLLICAGLATAFSRRFRANQIGLRDWWVPLALFGVSNASIVLVPGQALSLLKHAYLPATLAQALGLLVAFGVLQTRFRAVGDTRDFERLALRDALTGVANRRAFGRDLSGLRQQDAAFLLLLDLDHFKQVNDSRGHLFGDRVLGVLGELLRENVRGRDQVYRVGGEEFALLLHDTDEAGAAGAAERIRAQVERQLGARVGAPELFLTVSIGLAPAGESPEASFSAADRQLYGAKAAGRNTVCPA